MKKLVYRLLVILSAMIAPTAATAQVINLAGEWRFRLDAANKGLEEKWFDEVLPDRIVLPASCEEKGFGIQATVKDPHRLTRAVRYEGKAWYQRSITLPPSWREKRIVLFLERCHWVSSVWIDGLPLGTQNSLSAPHVYETGSLSPGAHTITICIDNTYGAIPIGTWGFAITDDTQGNWNGIIGRMELQATDPVWIRDVQVYPDHLQISIGNATGTSQQVTVQGKKLVVPIAGTVTDIPFTPAPGPWDEFSATMHSVTVILQSKAFQHTKAVAYGIRKLTTNKGQFMVNGRAVLMRGPVNECVYPATGYPPMDKEAWLRVLRICKSYGFNFMRFNSWCPPEAAFRAADETGIYLQVELPFWSIDAPVFGGHPQRDQFLLDELRRILTTYGNHPSFAFMAMGNESPGPFETLVRAGKKTDNRMLYRCQNGDTITNGDYAERGTEIGQRGIKGPRTDWDRWSLFKSKTIDHYKQSPLPTFAHEVGQWASYPDFDQLKKFTGNLKPYNYERFQQSLAAHHMASQAKDFAMASGRFAVSLYKDEIEGCLRSFPYGGFQIVEARDFPGEGAAVIGWLDAFWDSKGLITPEAFRRFCGPVVCLLRMPKRIYTNDEDFVAHAEVSNYTRSNIVLPAEWSITDEHDQIIGEGNFRSKTILMGQVTALGEIHASLKDVHAPSRLTVTVRAAGTYNSWNIWVYPVKQPEVPANVKVVYAFDEATKAALKNGENVLLFSDPSKGLYPIEPAFLPPDSMRLFPPVTKGRSAIPGSFMPAFWNMRLFNQPGTLSLLCDPHHPALQSFPTESHSDWQWADLLGQYTAQASYAIAGDREAHEWNDRVNRSKSVILNETPADFKPIVQVIDNYERNYRLGVIFETRVGKGKLLICTLDLDTDANARPAAQQLKSSLLQYASGKDFNPSFELNMEWLEKVLGE